jgi:type IV pilus assembly protein PilY1
LTSFTSGTTTHGDWELGQDMQDENGNSQTTTEIRPSVHGDVLHSRPVAIAYSGTYAGDVVVYYGSNDGILHAINGSRTGSIGSFPAGAELWSFVAPETYGNISTLYNNTATLNFTDLTAPSGKPYGFDGPITSYQGSGSTWVFAPMRRGGRALYAFDVTNPTSPSLKWKVGCPNNFTAFGTVSDTGCTTGFTGIGQTWSAGVTMTASGYTDPVLIMGGGYDTCEDADPRNCTGSAKGNHIYILNANDGTLQRTLDTDRAVTADVFVIKDSSTGIAKWAYAVDLGGNIYRISGVDANTPFNSTSPSSWTITKIASLGGTGASARKFLFSPDIVLDPDGSYDILVGSGDREKPLHSFSAAYGVTNYFFMVKDKPTDSSWLNTSNTDCGGGNNYICLASLNEIGVTNSTGCSTITGTPSSYGWYLDLNTHEQVVTSPITVFNTTTFSTHTPVSATSNICSSSLGTPRVYNINYTNPSTYGQCSSTAIQTYIGKDIGLPPSPVAGMVQLDDGTIVPFVIGADPTSPLQSKPPTGSSSWTQPTQNVYWFIQQ